MSGARRVVSYRVAWNITENVGTIRLLVEGGTELPPLKVAGSEFAAVTAILFNSDGKVPVFVGSNANGDAILGTQEAIGPGG